MEPSYSRVFPLTWRPGEADTWTGDMRRFGMRAWPRRPDVEGGTCQHGYPPGPFPRLHGEEAELHGLGACPGLTLQFMVLLCCHLVWCVNVLSKVGRPCFIVLKWPQTKTMSPWEMDAR